MAGRAAVLRRRLLLGLLGQQVSPQVAQSIEQSLSDTFQASTSPIGSLEQKIEMLLPWPTPASSGISPTIADLLYNAKTGNVSPDEEAQLAQQADMENVQAGGTPDMTASQTLMNTALTNSGPLPGAFGITWTGAQPGGTNWVTQAAANAANALGANSGAWVWWALGGVGVLWLLMRSK